MITIDSNAGMATAKLKHMAVEVQRGLDAGLTEVVLFGHLIVLENLSGKASASAGSDPVPVRTGHLRRSEDYITPGRNKHGLTTAHGQAMLVNTALYAHAIHEGKGPHSVFGRRPFMQSAADRMRQMLPNTMMVTINRSLSV